MSNKMIINIQTFWEYTIGTESSTSVLRFKSDFGSVSVCVHEYWFSLGSNLIGIIHETGGSCDCELGDARISDINRILCTLEEETKFLFIYAYYILYYSDYL